MMILKLCFNKPLINSRKDADLYLLRVELKEKSIKKLQKNSIFL